MVLDLSDYRAVCEKAVRAAGRLLLEKQGRVQVREKGPSDLVTEADLASQEMVRQIVLGAFPEHCLLGEEDSKPAAPRTEYRWIVDPLDGTTNYVHGIPFYSVSLALERSGELLVGAVYHPAADECFIAVLGQGAFLNGQRMHTSQVAELSHAVAATGFPPDVTKRSPDLLIFNEATPLCQSMRRTGSAAMNLAYVAAGRMDVFWSFSTKVWDVAAGGLLVREAGGVVTSPMGGKFALDSGQFLAAATPALHGQFKELIHRAVG
jgi:myo-inositol-1(or 4)-monophosphatase